MPATIDDNLIRIGDYNRLLADELAKLPELRRFESESTRLALADLFRIYRLAPNRFDRMFVRMDAVGLPGYRKYCAPLQALFWMIQDEKLRRSGMLMGLKLVRTRNGKGDPNPRLQVAGEPASDAAMTKNGPDYTLTKVLDCAWNGETELLRRSTIRQIIRRMESDEEAQEYALLVRRHSDRQLQGYIMEDYLRKKDVFSVEDWATIENAIRRSRWKRFYTVADRLNSPELISYYINNYFHFRKTPASGVYFTFFEKKAQCTDAAYFAQFMLERAGYRTFMRSVKWDDDPWNGLHTGAGIILDDGGYLLVSNYTGVNSISGPFKSIEGLDEKLSCERKIIGRRWGAFYPPRFY